LAVVGITAEKVPDPRSILLKSGDLSEIFMDPERRLPACVAKDCFERFFRRCRSVSPRRGPECCCRCAGSPLTARWGFAFGLEHLRASLKGSEGLLDMITYSIAPSAIIKLLTSCCYVIIIIMTISVTYGAVSKGFPLM
jgi:hypothetical protein